MSLLLVKVLRYKPSVLKQKGMHLTALTVESRVFGLTPCHMLKQGIR